MSILRILPALIAAATLLPAAADAQRPRDQGMPFRDAQSGRIIPLSRIEQRVQAHPSLRGATYLGPEFNAETGIYRLKFMRGGRVIWVDVDARTGRVVQTSGD